MNAHDTVRACTATSLTEAQAAEFLAHDLVAGMHLEPLNPEAATRDPYDFSATVALNPGEPLVAVLVQAGDGAERPYVAYVDLSRPGSRTLRQALREVRVS